MINLHFKRLITAIVIIFMYIYLSCTSLCCAMNGPIVISIESQQKHLIYLVENQQLDEKSLFYYLGRIINSKGQNVKIIILMDSELPISTISNVKGIIQKVGFNSIRFFYYGPTKKMMAEIIVDKPAVPFSTDPESLAKLQ